MVFTVARLFCLTETSLFFGLFICSPAMAASVLRPSLIRSMLLLYSQKLSVFRFVCQLLLNSSNNQVTLSTICARVNAFWMCVLCKISSASHKLDGNYGDGCLRIGFKPTLMTLVWLSLILLFSAFPRMVFHGL